MTTQTLKKQHTTKTPKRCSDCDADCWLVADHLRCWSGGLRFTGTRWELQDIADGLCPWVHAGVEKPEQDAKHD
jgi:hypothetical protein